jgi:zinc-binding in reverse transcriptase
MANAFINGTLHLYFKRQLVEILLQEWNAFSSELAIVSLYPSTLDINIWRWTVAGIFTVHSLYEWLDFGSVISHEFDIVWKSKIPLKVKKIMWLLTKNKILTKKNLIRRGWQGDTSCAFVVILKLLIIFFSLAIMSKLFGTGLHNITLLLLKE